MKSTAVIDSSALINLVHLGLAEGLYLFFGAVYVPRMVHREVNRRSKFRHRLNKLYFKGVFRRCAVGDPVSVQLLLGRLHQGEAEALVQASEVNVGVFIGDDDAARKNSERRGLKPVGTAGLLARLNLIGFAPETRLLIGRLRRDLSFRITDNIVAEAIERAGEPL